MFSRYVFKVLKVPYFHFKSTLVLTCAVQLCILRACSLRYVFKVLKVPDFHFKPTWCPPEGVFLR